MLDAKTGRFKSLPKEKKPADRSLSLLKTFEDGSGIIDSLVEEYEDWYDNMTGTSLEAMEKYDMVGEVARVMREQFDALEGLVFPDGISEIPIIIPLYPSGKSPSKAVRFSYACQILSSVCSVIVGDADVESPEASIFYIIKDMKERAEVMEQADEFARELQDIIDELEGIEFP